MKIDSVEITNFRGIASGKLEGFGRINVLIGKNNSGKSTVIEAIARGSREGGNRRDQRQRTVGLVFRSARSEEPSLPEAGAVVPENLTRLVRAGSTTMSILVRGAGNFVGDITSEPSGLSTCGGSVQGPVAIFFPGDATDRAVERDLWNPVFATREDRFLAASLGEIYGEKIDSIQMMPDGDLLLGFPTTGLRVDSQGTGFRAALRWLLVVVASRGGVVFTEEPECFQHPSALKKLALAITNRASADDTQFFITTHSLECVRAFAEAAPDTEKDKPWPFACFALERDAATGVMTSRRLAKETVLGLDEAGTDVRFLEDYQ